MQVLLNLLLMRIDFWYILLALEICQEILTSLWIYKLRYYEMT